MGNGDKADLPILTLNSVFYAPQKGWRGKAAGKSRFCMFELLMIS